MGQKAEFGSGPGFRHDVSSMKISTQAPSTSLSTSLGQSASMPRAVGGQQSIDIVLFGKRPARLVDPRRFPHLKKAMRKLGMAKDQLADVLGVSENTFSVALAEGENASINRGGQIAFGLELLEKHERDDALLVAVMAHEIGHQPWKWPKGDMSHLTKKAIDQISREEEARADRFCGKALADLAVSFDPICDFLLAHGKFENYPAVERVEMIQAAFTKRRRALNTAAHLSPRALERQRQLR